MKYVVPKELLPLLRSKVTRKEVEEMISSGRYLPIASAGTLGAIRVGDSLTIDSDGVLSVVGSGVSVEWGNISNKPTTISGYGITDAGISGNTITLGNTSITPLTSFTETDPTVPSWAKQSSKPSYSYSEISNTPTNVSAFVNDVGYLTEHQSLDALTPKVQAIPYIVGPDTDTTAGTWTGTYAGITELTDGLTIIYVPHVAGASTTRLNINGLGAFICYYTNTAKITTQYAVGVPILLTYRTVSDVGRWCRADYNSNTTYSAGTKALFDEGTNTSNRVWSAKVLADSVAPIEHEHDWSDINNAPAFITADALNGYATEQYVDTEISDLNLGTASQKDYTTSVTKGGADLPTSDAVYSAISSAVTSALHYRGMSSTAITDGGTETATIGGQPLTAQSGDIVIYDGLEFLWEEGHWNKLGDDSSYALKTVTVTGTDGITGGGDLTANRTLGLSSTTQTNINKGVTAYGWGDHSQAGYLTSFTETDPTVPSWAKASTKPSYDYDEIENTPFIPTNVSDLTNDAGYISTETDPVFSASAAHGITSSNISSWNSKYSKPSGGIPKTDLASSVQTTLSNADTAYSWGDHAQAGYLTSFTETDPVFSASPSHGITANDITNWNTAFSWGNHASAGYALSADIPTDVSDLNNDAGFITSADIPTNVSAFTNDAGYLTQHQSLDNYYTKSEVDTKTAKTTARADNKLLYNGQTVDTGLSGLGISTANNLLNSGYHMAIRSNDTNPFFGLKQGSNLWYAQAASGYFYFGPTSSKALRLDQNGNGVFQTGSVTATSIIKSGGTSSQFLKADGSVDSNSYLTSFTETDPIFSASDAAGITAADVSNWDDAYSWGNHANAGYLTSVPIATGSVAGGFIYGDPIDTLIVLNNGYLAVDLLGLDSLIESKGYITGYTETDPTVPAWAKASSKPTYTADEVGALPDDTVIPSKTSDLINDSGFITGYTETDPVFTASAAHGITSSDITSWNGKYSKPSGGIPKTDLASAVQTSLNKADTALQSFTETDPTVPNWAKQANKPTYTASEVGALPDTTVIPTKTSDLTNDSGFITGYTETDPIFSASVAAGITSSDVSAWDDKQDAISDLSTIRTNASHGNTAYGWGDHSQAGYLTSYTETDPVFSASAASGITSSNISTWNGKYAKPSTGIPKTDLASAVQTTLSNADTAYGWGNHASAGYLTSSSLDGYVNEIATGTGNYISGVSKSGKKLTFTYGTLPTTIAWGSVTGKPTTISGYGITDAKIANGTITLGSNSITPLTSFTETDPTVPSWAKQSSKPTYTLDEVADGSTRKLADYVSKVTSTDNAIARFNGTGGAVQNSVVTIDDDGNIFFPIATSTSFSANAKIVLGNAWFGQNPSGGLCYGTRSGSTYTSKYCFEGIQFRPVSTSDNQINIGTTSYRWKNIYLAGTIGNGTYALTLPSKSGTIAVTDDLDDYVSKVTSTDNAIARFNGTGGAIQNSGVLIDDSDNLSLPLGSSSSFSANSKLIIGKAWLGTNTAGALSYGIISGSAYNSYFAFEGTGLRPANSSSAGDNKLNIGTSTVRFKDAYFGGTINTAGADISDSLSIPTDAPSSTTSGKIYLYASSTGSYAVEPWYGFNQLISNGNMESTTGWGTVYSGYTRTVENNVLTITITSATYRPQVRTALSVANGHWVYYTYTMKYTTSAAYSDVKTAFLYPTPQYIPTGNQKDADYYNWKKISGIVKVNAAKTYLYIGRTAASSHTFAVGDTVQIKNVMVCDLTEMFGENIPTVEQFEAMYPQDYYEYTPIGG